MEFFLDIHPPTVTAQEHKVRVVRGRPQFYDTPRLKAARSTFESLLRQHKPGTPLEGPVALTVDWHFSTKSHREGTYRVTRPDTDNLQKLLNGYITEDALAAQNENAPAEEEAPVEETAAELAEDETTGEPVTDGTEDTDTTGDADSDTDSEAPASMLSNIDEQTITIPAPDITVEQLRNLTYTLYSRQYILNLMTGGQTIAIPLELIEALQEALPATPGDFTALLDNHSELGLKGFDFRDGQFSLTFPFYETEPTKWTTFAGLQGRILLAAREAKRVFPELIQPEEEAEKYTAHIWLQRMGYKGPEMKEQRNILLKHLHGYCAFSNGSKMQNHKDKYSAIRRERREAERAAASGEMDVEVTMPTTEAEPSVVMAQKEVVSND